METKKLLSWLNVFGLCVVFEIIDLYQHLKDLDHYL